MGIPAVLGALTSAWGVAKAIGKGVNNFAQGVAPWAQMYGQYKANQENIQSARQQMDYQTMMSNTAHQREVEDLRKAGLNPMLSINKGASTPQGAGYQVENIAADLPDALAKISEVELTKANSALTVEKTNTERLHQKILAADAGIRETDLKYADKRMSNEARIKEFGAALAEIEVNSAKKKNELLDLEILTKKPNVTIAEIKEKILRSDTLKDLWKIFDAWVVKPSNKVLDEVPTEPWQEGGKRTVPIKPRRD